MTPPYRTLATMPEPERVAGGVLTRKPKLHKCKPPSKWQVWARRIDHLDWWQCPECEKNTELWRPGFWCESLAINVILAATLPVFVIIYWLGVVTWRKQ